MGFEQAAIAVAVGSLAVSALTAWATLLRGGRVRMTQPAVIYFGPDGGRERKRKVFLRTLLYSTGHKGRIIEGMFVKLTRDDSVQVFNIWVHGADKTQLIRGSGLKVDPDGLVLEHHFLLPAAASTFEFLSGSYRLEAYASVLGQSQPLRLFSCSLPLTSEQAAAIQSGKSGVYFDWGPNSQAYHASIQVSRLRSEALAEALAEMVLHGPADAPS